MEVVGNGGFDQASADIGQSGIDAAPIQGAAGGGQASPVLQFADSAGNGRAREAGIVGEIGRSDRPGLDGDEHDEEFELELRQVVAAERAMQRAINRSATGGESQGRQAAGLFEPEALMSHGDQRADGECVGMYHERKATAAEAQGARASGRLSSV